jgi:hypothetical protein
LQPLVLDCADGPQKEIEEETREQDEEDHRQKGGTRKEGDPPREGIRKKALRKDCCPENAGFKAKFPKATAA